LFRRGDYTETTKNERLSWVPVSVRTVPVARKLDLSTRNKGFFFEEEIVETQAETPENLSKPVLNSLPDKVSSCSSETKHDRRTAQDQMRLFRREDYRYKSHNHNKALLDLSPIKMVYAVVITVDNTVE
jgi:hypothetical protein